MSFETGRGKVEDKVNLDADQSDSSSQSGGSSQSCTPTSEHSAAGEFIHSHNVYCHHVTYHCAFIDFKKAFYRVAQSNLWYKLLQIRGISVSTFKYISQDTSV